MRNYKEPTGSQKKSCARDSHMIYFPNVPSVDSDAGAGSGAVILHFLLHFWSPEQGWSQGRCLEMCVERMAGSINQTQDFLTIIRLSKVHTPSAQTEKKKSLHLGFQIRWRQNFTSFSLGNSLSTTAAIGLRSAPGQSGI